MNVSLTPELEEFVADRVRTGRYGSASEVVREALRMLEERSEARNAALLAWDQELHERLASLNCGERVDPKAARRRLAARSRKRSSLRA